MRQAIDDQPTPDIHPAHPALGRIRGVLFVLLVFGIVVTLGELLLLEHTEDYWQLAPLLILGLGLLLIPLVMARPSTGSVRTFQAIMVLFVVSGFIGLFLHYRGNAEFELEMYPSLAGFKLFWEALKGATPTLAPAAMTFLGVVGLTASATIGGSETIEDDRRRSRTI